MNTNSLAPNDTESNSNLNEYQRRALATRKRRQAAGKYPTDRQRRAFAKYLSSQSLTPQEYKALSTHPYLLERQRAKFAAMCAEEK